MSDLPAPLVPPEVDLGANDWFPLYHRRLPKSRWWRQASDMARSRNVDLWCYSYGETPAGSLPDDDLELAEAAGFGRDVAGFTVAKAEILAPWTLCVDGRWYHPALCEVVLEAWERTSEKRRQQRARQQAHRDRMRANPTKAQNATLGENADATSDAPSGAPPGVTRDTPPLSRVTPPLVTRDAPTQTDKTDKPLSQNAPSAHATGVRVSQAQPWKGEADFLALWNGATDQMRRRAKSKALAWKEWVKVRKAHDGARIVAGLRAYLKGDPDVSRTGGPGLHIWLRDQTFDLWSGDTDAAEAWPPERWGIALGLWQQTGEWGDGLGPKPGEPGCMAPAALLLRVAG